MLCRHGRMYRVFGRAGTSVIGDSIADLAMAVGHCTLFASAAGVATDDKFAAIVIFLGKFLRAGAQRRCYFAIARLSLFFDIS